MSGNQQTESAYPRRGSKREGRTGLEWCSWKEGAPSGASEADAALLRLDKVLRVRKAIAEGTYHVSAEELVETFLMYAQRRCDS